jgi:hypothetical protein
MAAIIHPEWVDGRRLWIDGPMQDLIDKLHYGDSAKGWEGDPALAVYFHPEHRRWELWRLEHTGRLELVARSKPDIPFHDGIIDQLMLRDQKYNTIDRHAEATAFNEAVDAEKQRKYDDFVTEEAAPRLVHAVRKDSDW